MSDFSTLITDAQAFYAKLHANNTKSWWQDNKATYETRLKAPALDLLATCTPHIAALTDTTISSKLFRPHRDVRFSKDKTPYNTHLHMMWQLESDARQNPVFFFGIGVDYVTCGAGIMGFEKPVLDDWRKFVDLDTKRITGITETLKQKGFAFRDPALKRIPTGFAPDHAAGDLLRMKGVVASKDIGPPTDLPTAIQTAFQDAWPLNALLLQIAEA
jgi:uncharacterized protein (TIGR02453 family)